MIKDIEGIPVIHLSCDFFAVKLTADVLNKFKKKGRLLLPLHDLKITAHLNKNGVITHNSNFLEQHFLEDHYALRLPFPEGTVCVPSIEQETGMERGIEELKRKFIKFK